MGVVESAVHDKKKLTKEKILRKERYQMDGFEGLLSHNHNSVCIKETVLL